MSNPGRSPNAPHTPWGRDIVAFAGAFATWIGTALFFNHIAPGGLNEGLGIGIVVGFFLGLGVLYVITNLQG